MTTTTREYKSTDASAPILTGQTGSLIALVKAVLVGTSGVAYGSGGTAKTAAGWTTLFTPTATKCVFKNSAAAGGTGVCVRFLDDGSGAAGFKEGFFRSYATMSDIDTGTDLTPSVAQMATGVDVRKSVTADGTARAWNIVADELTCYIQIESNAADIGENSFYGFGDFLDFVAGSGFRFFSMGRNTYNTAAGACGALIAKNLTAATPALANEYGLWLPRGIALTGTALAASIGTMFTANASAMGGFNSTIADPAPGAGGRLYIPAIIVNENTVRGILRGCFVPLCSSTSVANATVDSAPIGQPVGSTFKLFRAMSRLATTSTDARVAVETALAWPT